MENLLQDLRYGLRVLLKRPVFTLVAVVSLALGIGPNTAIFSLVDAVLWRTVPVEDPETLVALYTKDEKNPGHAALSHLNWKDYRQMSRSFSGVLGYTFAPVSLQTGGEPVRSFVVLASGNYFDLLGIRAERGRTFLPEEDGEPGAHPVVVVSHRFWRENLGSDPQAVGRAITINGTGYTVIGVIPESFTGTDIGLALQLWVPMAMNRQIIPNKEFNWFEERRGLMLNAIGRLRPGATRAAAQAEITTIGARLRRDHPDDNKGRSVDLVPLAQTALGGPEARQAMMAGTGLLMAVVGLVLLIACANVSNLLLAQAVARKREMAIRLSQGAARGRLIRQLLTESLLLSLLGGALGLLIAKWVQALLPKLIPQGPFPLDVALTLDGRILAFTLGVSLVTGLLFGLVPALQASKADLVSALKNQAQTEVAGLRGFGVRGGLVAGQVALSVVSLIAAGLFVRSLGEMQRVDPGFPAEKLAVVSFDTGLQGWDKARSEGFFREVRERIARVPGVASVSLGQVGPFGFAFTRSVFLEGEENAKNGTMIQVNTVTPEYFDTMGIEVRGRTFTEADREGGARAVIINETMAKMFWPNQDALGKRFHFFGTAPSEVVGVARTVKYNFPGEDPQPYAYEPLAQRFVTGVTMMVRADRSPENVLPAVQQELRAMAPTMPLTGVSTVHGLLRDSLWLPRAGASLLALFGLLALGLASVGLYGVMSFAVTQRSREIGVRMALGAQNADVLRLVLRQGLTVVAMGLVAGLLLAFGATRLIGGMLFGITPTDPMAFGVTFAVLSVVAFGATLIPALRAISIPPILAIRYE